MHSKLNAGCFVRFAFALAICSLAMAADRPAEAPRAEAPVGWRTDGTGRYPDARPPVEWSGDTNIVWKTALPGRSHAAAVVAGDLVFATAEPTELLCLSADTGRVLWQRSTTFDDAFGAEKAEQIADNHRQAEELRQQRLRPLRQQLDELKNANANAEKTEPLEKQIRELDEQLRTLLVVPAVRRGVNGNTTACPVTDGRRVFMVFGTGIVTGFSNDGDRLWITHVDASDSGFGHSASLLLIGNKLIVHHENLTALDAETGKELWRHESSCRFGSPVATRVGEVDLVVTPNGAVVRADDGTKLADRLFNLGHSSPVVEAGVVYAVEGGTNKAWRLPQSIDRKAESIAPELLWESRGFQQRTFASPLYHDGLLYIVTEQGILDVLDAATGEPAYRKRLDLGNGHVYPSATSAGRYIFIGSDNGTTVVLEPGREYKELARNTLEGTSGSATFIGERMYLRGYTHLYCIGR